MSVLWNKKDTYWLSFQLTCRRLAAHWNSSSDERSRVFSLLVTLVDLTGLGRAELTAAPTAATVPLELAPAAAEAPAPMAAATPPPAPPTADPFGAELAVAGLTELTWLSFEATSPYDSWRLWREPPNDQKMWNKLVSSLKVKLHCLPYIDVALAKCKGVYAVYRMHDCVPQQKLRWYVINCLYHLKRHEKHYPK